MKKKLFFLIFTIIVVLCSFGTVFAANNTTEMVSVASNGTQGNQASDEAVISADGRFVVFSSDADNLVWGDTNGYRDVFVRDLLLNTTERVSISSSGDEGDNFSIEPDISADGRYVVFTSLASNLVAGVSSISTQLYVRDRLLGITELLTISPEGTPGDGWSGQGSISADGRYVAFVSSSTNLMGSVTEGRDQIYIKDRVLNLTEMASVSNDGSMSGGGWPPSISGDGRFVTFVTWAPLDGVNDLWADLFVYDHELKTITKIVPQFNWDEGRNKIYQTSLSGDGRYLAFVNRPFIIYGHPDGNDPHYSQYFTTNIFVWDRVSENIKMVSRSDGGDWANSGCSDPFLSSDGRYLTFTSYATNLVAGDDNNAQDIFLCDLQSGTIQRVIEFPVGYFGSNFHPSLSARGNYLVFNCEADLVDNDSNGVSDVFIFTFKKEIIIQGTINPFLVKKGDIIEIKVNSNELTEYITATIDGINHDLVKQSDNSWIINYVVPDLSDGVYLVHLTAYAAGDSVTAIVNFTVDNTAPRLVSYVLPNLTKTGQVIQIKTTTDLDVVNLTAEINGVVFNLLNSGNGVWVMNYTVPQLADGFYNILLNATDRVGNSGVGLVGFTADNTPPTINPVVTVVNGLVFIKVLSDSDTKKITVEADGKKYSLQYQGGDLWVLNNPFALKNGLYVLNFAAEDGLQNIALLQKNITIDHYQNFLLMIYAPEAAGGSKISDLDIGEGKSTSSMVFMGNNAQGAAVNDILLSPNLKTDYGVLLSHPKYQEALKKFEQMSPSQKQDVLDKLQSNLKVDPNKENAFQALEKYLKENPWAVYLLTALAIAGLILITGGTGAMIPIFYGFNEFITGALTGTTYILRNQIIRTVQLGIISFEKVLDFFIRKNIPIGTIPTILNPDLVGVGMWGLDVLASRFPWIYRITFNYNYNFLAYQTTIIGVYEFLNAPFGNWNSIIGGLSNPNKSAPQQSIVKKLKQKFKQVVKNTHTKIKKVFKVPAVKKAIKYVYKSAKTFYRKIKKSKIVKKITSHPIIKKVLKHPLVKKGIKKLKNTWNGFKKVVKKWIGW